MDLILNNNTIEKYLLYDKERRGHYYTIKYKGNVILKLGMIINDLPFDKNNLYSRHYLNYNHVCFKDRYLKISAENVIIDCSMNIDFLNIKGNLKCNYSLTINKRLIVTGNLYVRGNLTLHNAQNYFDNKIIGSVYIGGYHDNV